MAKASSAARKMTYKEFRAWRLAREWTQQEAADYLHLSISTIRAYEANPRRNEKARDVPEYMRRYLEALHAEDKLKELRSERRREKRDP
jgi:transcriptional regulator with XRE-family HTH domain